MGYLLKTTKDFKIHGIERPGIPFLVDDEMRIVEAPTAWLLELASQSGGKRYSIDSLHTYAEALDDFFETLEANQWHWDELVSDDIDAYVARQQAVTSLHTKRKLKASTINLRIKVISQFFDWAVARGMLPSSPIVYKHVRAYEDPLTAAPLQHIRGAADVRKNTHLLRSEIREPHAMSAQAVRSFLNMLTPTFRLISECALSSGARRFELAGMELPEWRTPVHVTAHAVAIKPTIAKRNNTAPLWIPTVLYEHVNQYISEDRAIRVARMDDPPKTVFVNRNGAPISRKLITQTFYRVSTQLGEHHAFHDLRHTFITRVADELMKAKRLDGSRINAGLALKVLARHKSIRSSFVYLHSVQNDPEILAYATSSAYSQWL